MLAPKHIAVIGFGEAGTVIAGGCISGSQRQQNAVTCHMWDIRMQDAEAKKGLEEKAAGLGVVPHEIAGDWLKNMDVVFSLVLGGVAKDVALNTLPLMKEEAAYIDLTTSVPDDMREAAAAFKERKVGFIDGTALGSFRTNGMTAPFVLSGTNVESWSAWMNSLGFATTPVPGGAGSASCVKLLRSVLAKGLEALAIECFTAAESMGLRETMQSAFKDFDLRPLASSLEDMSASHIPHCKRRLDEIDHVLHMLDSVSVDGAMTRASREFYARTVNANAQLVPGKQGTWDACLPAFQKILHKK
jgi:3-hydroxyisobutyrate dehydrogenase-like beta-hydroxyacid dehydrogenase